MTAAKSALVLLLALAGGLAGAALLWLAEPPASVALPAAPAAGEDPWREEVAALRAELARLRGELRVGPLFAAAPDDPPVGPFAAAPLDGADGGESGTPRPGARAPGAASAEAAGDSHAALARLEQRLAALEARLDRTGSRLEGVDLQALQEQSERQREREREQRLWQTDWPDLTPAERQEKKRLMVESWSRDVPRQAAWFEERAGLQLADPEREKLGEAIRAQYGEQLDYLIEAADAGVAMEFDEARNRARETTFAKLATFLRADQVQAYRDWLERR